MHDTLSLKVSSYALKEVVVQAKISNAKQTVSSCPSPLPPGKTEPSYCRRLPGVWLAEDNISINGAQGTKVFVDNREIKLTGEELLTYLRSLKSEDIRRIEVILIAGAEYEASSRGGIIPNLTPSAANERYPGECHGRGLYLLPLPVTCLPVHSMHVSGNGS